MSRARLLIENFMAYGTINVLNKVIPFLLLPVITRLLTDPSDFGIYDMYNLIVSFGSPLAMLGMYDAMFREYFEKEDQDYRYNVTATANRIILVSSLIVATILIIFNISFSRLFFGTPVYSGIIIFSAVQLFLSTNRQIIAAPTRIQNRRKVYVFSGITQSLTYYLLAILLIYLGYSYLGMIYGNIVSTVIILVFFWVLNKDFFTQGKYDKRIARELFKIGIPLLPSLIILWVFKSMDRIMITNMLGTTELGIYSIGARVASISSIIHGAFVGGWQYFAFSTMRDEDYKFMMGKIWEILFIIVSCLFVIIFLFKDLVFNFLFVGAYRNGVIIFPYLFLAPLLQMLQQVLGTQYHVIKKTYYSPVILSLGAVVNLALNFYLIPLMGIKGAALATLLGFVVVVGVSILIVVFGLKLIHFRYTTFIAMIIFTTVFIYLAYYDISMGTILAGVGYLGLMILLYRKELKMFLKKLGGV